MGTNNVLKAFMTSGLSIEEINKLVSEGATIDDEGIITLSTNGKIKEDINVSASQKNSNNIGGLIVAIVVVLAVALSVVIIAVWKKRKNDKHNESMEDEQ